MGGLHHRYTLAAGSVVIGLEQFGALPRGRMDIKNPQQGNAMKPTTPNPWEVLISCDDHMDLCYVPADL